MRRLDKPALCQALPMRGAWRFPNIGLEDLLKRNLKMVGRRGNPQFSNLFLARKRLEIKPFFIGKKLMNQFVIQGVAGFIADEMPDDLGPQEP